MWEKVKLNDLVKSLKTVTPAEAGVQNSLNLLDSRFRGNDKNGEIATFYEFIKLNLCHFFNHGVMNLYSGLIAYQIQKDPNPFTIRNPSVKDS